jgi:phosphoglycerate dehydrogenase-like enzyme
MINAKSLENFKRGAYLINTARGKLCVAEDVAQALRSGRLAAYAGDVWFPQPPPKDHPWRTMPHHGMTPHISGTSLSAQSRYAAGTREILECYFENSQRVPDRAGWKTRGRGCAFLQRRQCDERIGRSGQVQRELIRPRLNRPPSRQFR